MTNRELSDSVLTMEAIPAIRAGAVLDRSHLRPEELLVAALIDGKRRVGDLVRDSGMPASVVFRLLRSLYEREYIVPSDSARAVGRATALYLPLQAGPRQDWE